MKASLDLERVLGRGIGRAGGKDAKRVLVHEKVIHWYTNVGILIPSKW